MFAVTRDDCRASDIRICVEIVLDLFFRDVVAPDLALVCVEEERHSLSNKLYFRSKPEDGGGGGGACSAPET